MILSEAQSKAIHPHYSCWVEASAGTGKTKVLTDRVMSLLLAGVSVDEILCLTFTKAAGAEMAERIRQNLMSWTTMDDETLRLALRPFLGTPPSDSSLKRARSLFFMVLKSNTGIRIQTIHGFCQFLLRAFPLEAGLLPHFRVMDEGAQAQLLKKVEKVFWQTLSVHQRDGLIHYLSITQFEQFVPFILGIRHLLDDPAEGQAALTRYLNVKDVPTDVCVAFMESRRHLFQGIQIDSPKTQRDHLFLDLISLFETEISLNILYDAYKTFLLTSTGQPRKTILSKGVQQKHPKLQDILVAEQAAFLHAEDQRARQVVHKKSSLLMDVGQHFLSLYQRHKNKAGVVDYDDLIHNATLLLQKADIKPWVLEKLDYHFHHILVDEAQDTSETQWKLLFQLISEFFTKENDHNRTLFIVGDPKQSIYSFQGASPHGFQQASQMFQSLDRAQSVHLTTSYRSAPEVLHLVNALFEDNNTMGASLPPHVAHRVEAKGAVVFHPLIKLEMDDAVSPWTPSDHQKIFITARRKVAEQIADQIKSWIEMGTILPQKNRPIMPRDIMILVRRRDQFMLDMVQALKTRGVPVSGVDRISLGAHIAVKDLLALLDILLMPHDDLTLATVLKSPLFNVTETTLKELCMGRAEPLWDMLDGAHKDIQNTLQSLQQSLHTIPTLSGFFYDVLISKNNRQKFIDRMGVGVDDILTSFLDMVTQFEEDHSPHAAQFITWMRNQDSEIKRSQEGVELNEVRLMTVHAAKGLQAPIVMLPDTTQVPQNSSSFYAQEGKPFFLWADGGEKCASSTIASFCAHNIRDAEYQRLLYVAVTRAEDYLYIYGWDTKQNVSDASWYKQIQKAMDRLSITTDEVQIYGEVPLKNDTPTILNTPFYDDCSLPNWTMAQLPPESFQKITPSDTGVMSQEENKMLSLQKPSAAQTKGVRIHHILEHAIRTQLPLDQVEKYMETLPADEARDDIQNAVKLVLAHPILKNQKNRSYKTEVGIKGIVNQQHINGIVDLLILCHETKTIWILDYKTGRFHEIYKTNPPPHYRSQMMCYRQLMEKIYPDYTLHIGLIWTETGWLQLL